LRERRHRRQGRIPPGRRAPRRPDLRARHRRLLLLPRLELQPRAAPPGRRREGRGDPHSAPPRDRGGPARPRRRLTRGRLMRYRPTAPSALPTPPTQTFILGHRAVRSSDTVPERAPDRPRSSLSDLVEGPPPP